jgi:hypothetical protein
MAAKKANTKKVRGDTAAKPKRSAPKGKSTTGGKVTATGKTTKTAEAPAKPKRISGLDAAARVLTEAAGAMGSRKIVDVMLAKGFWKTRGKTPHATIYAAMIREIQKKGKEARFEKVARGRFTLRK